MIAFFIITSVISPPLLTWILWVNIEDQKDQYGMITQTADDARKEVLPKILKSWGAILYYIWIVFLVGIITALWETIIT